jgi:hypothetical protein
VRLDPVSTYDAMHIIASLSKQGRRPSRAEIHLFAYLACLLWLYNQRPITDWGYTFIGTAVGGPFSSALESTLEELSSRRFLGQEGPQLTMSDEAEKRLHTMQLLSMYHERKLCLDAACASTTALSVGMVGAALSSDADLRRSRILETSVNLLNDTSLDQLYSEFHALRRAVHTTGRDLRLPAVVWLTALYKMTQEDHGDK